MNPFESDLLKARRRHRIIMMGAVMVGVIVVVAIVVGLYAGNGTRIEVLPQDTRDTAVVRVVAGAAVAFKGVVYSLGATPTVAVSADGFETATAVISHAQKARTVTITLKEIPATLTIVTEPPRQETRWAIDDNPPQIAEQITQTVPSGRHRLRIENPYFKKEVLELDLKRAENRRITMPLGAISGKVRIATQPDSAKVRIEGKEVGVSPVEVELPGGRHRVTVTKEGYLDLIDRIEIRNDRLSHARNYILQRRSATLAFSVVHKGGVLLLNGKEISPSQSRKVSANQAHQVTYALAGYITETKVVTLKPDETRLLRFKLKPDLGVVDILVEPGGDIFVDGKRAGKDALTLKLPSWRHRLDVFRKGYRTVTRNFQPSSGRKTVLNIVMETELAARLRETPETYTNSAGIRLARFKPGSIIMGAPRHETGQRANEILREVYLKKYFYAALHEVTEAQYGKFSGKAGGNLPVVSVTWLDAASFCNWLSLKEGLPPFYSIKEGKLRAVNAAADGYRFLTEAEWEWLARRAGKTAQTTFTWGDKPLVPRGAGNIADENANGITRYYVPNYNDGHKQRAPVGRFPAEPSGLFDLTGNVREWVHDSYSIILPIKGKVMVDPVYTTLGDVHTVKGSSWKTGTRSPLRAAYREGLSGSRDDIGFRIGRYLYGQDISAKN